MKLVIKKTIIGWLPEAWELKKLKNFVKFLDSDREPVKQSERAKLDNIYPYYGASGIIDHVDDYLFDDDLILLAEDGANIINRSSPIAFRVTGKCWVNNHAHVLKPKKNNELRYILEYLESIRYEKYNTSTAQPKLSQSTCRNIPVPKPPKDEQKIIAEIFSDWHEAIQTIKNLVQAKKRYKKGLMQQLLSGKKRFPEFKGGKWQEVELGNVFQRVTEKNESEEVTNVLTISAQDGLVSQTDYYNKSVASKNLSRYIVLKKGDFAYNKSYSDGYPLGAIKRLEEYEEGVLSPLYICFRPGSSKIDSDFMTHYFENGGLDHEIYKIAREGARNHGLLNVSIKDFFKTTLKVPQINEQKKIASVLNNVKKEIELLEQKLDAVKKQKKGLMQQLLTGKVRVNKEEDYQHAL